MNGCDTTIFFWKLTNTGVKHRKDKKRAVDKKNTKLRRERHASDSTGDTLSHPPNDFFFFKHTTEIYNLNVIYYTPL